MIPKNRDDVFWILAPGIVWNQRLIEPSLDEQLRDAAIKCVDPLKQSCFDGPFPSQPSIELLEPLLLFKGTALLLPNCCE